MTDRRGTLADDRAHHLQALASILARGYVRLLLRGRISSGELARQPESAAPCGKPVNAPERREEVSA